MINLFSPTISEVAIANAVDCLSKGHLSKGAYMDRLAPDFKRILSLEGDLDFVNSGTAALHLALEAINVEGKKVFVAAQSFMATALAIRYARAEPHFVDVNEDDGNISIKHLKEQIELIKGGAILAVHWGGNPCNIEALESIASEYEIPLLFDCAHALSSSYKGASVLNYGDFSIGSFQSIKEVTSVDGGIVVANNPTLKSVKYFSWFGMDRPRGRTLSFYGNIGYKYRMNNLNASILAGEIDLCLSNFAKRSKIARLYDSIIPLENRVKIEENSQSSYWLYSLLLRNRSEFIEFFNSKRIETSVVDLSMVHNPIFRQNINNFPGNKKFEAHHLAIPCRPNLLPNEVEHICNSLSEFFK